MRAVVEVPAFDVETPPPWPVESMAPFSWLLLDGSCSSEQVGLFVAALAARIDVPLPRERDEVVDALLAEELLIVAGGLQVADTETQARVDPGCCAGLEDWRNWAQVLAGESPWLGHDPSPEVEVLDGQLRVWQDCGSDRYHVSQAAAVYVDLPQAALPELLRNVHRDLIDFIGVLGSWAEALEDQRSGKSR